MRQAGARRQESTGTMEVEVYVEGLRVRPLDLFRLALWDGPIPHLLAPCNKITWGLRTMLPFLPSTRAWPLVCRGSEKDIVLEDPPVRERGTVR